MSQSKKPEESLEDSVMSRISSGDVKMKSKAHFIALNSILIASASLFTLLSALFVSMSVRDVRLGRELRLNDFGSPGDQEFMASLPWLMLLFGITAIGATLLLVKHFEFTYRHKTTVVIATVLIAILGLAGLTSASGLHDRLAGAPPFKPLNTLQKLADEKRIFGVIEEIGEESITVKLPNGELVQVKEVRKYRDAPNIEAGDKVVLFGEYVENGESYFKAYGIRKGDPRVRKEALEKRLKGDFGEIKGAHRQY